MLVIFCLLKGYIRHRTMLLGWLPCGTGNCCGTMIANTSTYYPSPWISDSGSGTVNHNPGIIWYLVH
jgi:formate/nitrite transporter FocA (FNT family)